MLESESGFEGVEFSGEPSGTPIIKRPKINICDFKDSEYNIPVTDKDAVDEVFGIVERRLGKEYKFWFEFVIGEKKKYDYFSIAYENGKPRHFCDIPKYFTPFKKKSSAMRFISPRTRFMRAV